MRTVCLWFPRLAVQLATRQRPVIARRTIILIAGHGDDALVAETSCDAAVLGVLRGMSAGQARGRCPGAIFLPDNGGHCLEELERMATIIQKRATDPVAIGGRDHLLVQADPSVGEAALAARLAALASAWSGLTVQAGVADTAAEALDAARASRGRPVVCPSRGASEPVIAFRPERIKARSRVAAGSGELAARAALQRLVARAQTVLEGRGQSYRRAIITIENGGERNEIRLAPHAPSHDAQDILALAARAVGPALLASAETIEVTLDQLGPDVRVRPCRAGTRVERPAHTALRRTG